MKKETIDAQKLIDKRMEKWNLTHSLDIDREYTEKVVEFLQRNTEQSHQLINELLKNPEKFIELFLVIVDKNQDTVPFFLNDVQKELVNTLNKAQMEYDSHQRNHLKFLLLKGRQQGFTQFITAYQLCCCLTRKNFAGFTLADTAENTEVIFTDKAKFPLDNLHEYLRPSQKYNNRRELHFQKPDAKGLNSRMRVSTAGNDEVGRSKTLNFFHGSEVAFWKDLNKILNALGEALTQNCISILETTANGYNAYKQLWDDDTNNWQKLFFPWWKTQEYRLNFESSGTKEWFSGAVEASQESENDESEDWVMHRVKWLMDMHNLELEQGYWYYNKWRDLKGDIKQEYPCSPQEAFLSTGQNFFDVERLTKRLEEVKNVKPIAQGFFEYKYTTDQLTMNKVIDTETIEWVDSGSGEIKIYIEAEPTIPYIVGADTASDGTDNNIAQVIDKAGRQHATVLVSKDEDLFAEQMFCLGWYYNNAMIVPEVNHSTHPTKVLVERGYPNVYIRGRAEAPVDMGQQSQPRYGFRTDANNRPSMLGLLRQLVREHVDYINDKDTILEMLTFIRNDKGKPEAEAGEHDDRVMAYAIALQTVVLSPDEVKPELEELRGHYTEAELEDLGYSKYEIKGYISGRMTLYREGKKR